MNLCKECKKEIFLGEKEFCSKSCNTKYRNRENFKNGTHSFLKKKECTICNKLIPNCSIKQHLLAHTKKMIKDEKLKEKKNKEKENVSCNCTFCNKLCINQHGLRSHQSKCKLNPNLSIEAMNRKTPWSIERKERHSKIMKELYTRIKPRIKSDEEKRRSSLTMKEISKTMWTPERRKQHSDAMKKAVDKYPESYQVGNMQGRTKCIETVDSFGKNVKLNGNWEVLLANYLDKNSIKWERCSKGFEYEFENKTRKYFPDFYLIEYDTFIEVKGFLRERDKAKFQYFKHRLIKIMKKEIDLIKEGIFDIHILLNCV